ncbi:RING finger protein 11-like isoform X1 [Stylophora pistillata]|uniref:RING finger protein 11 n=1 Tax=Stylophora pistillata TaxID=50429 RepID=A0A2B4SLD9_STYPI|nr:RING finger protein 11-like isoform X1 [Stylophora pistillata]PFX30186.1 RING finger protein 11 [Stylophora pistillata]
MGNCLKSSGQDDISLVHDEESADSPTTGEPPPPYQVEKRCHILPRLITLASILSHSRHFSFQEEAPIFIQSQHAPHLLSEEQQIRLAQRLGLIQHLPVGKYDGSKGKKRECVICMTDFAMGDPIRFLPCMHIYHKDCIEDWLVRSFTCPSCMEPVEAALLSTYYEASTE